MRLFWHSSSENVGFFDFTEYATAPDKIEEKDSRFPITLSDKYLFLTCADVDAIFQNRDENNATPQSQPYCVHAAIGYLVQIQRCLSRRRFALMQEYPRLAFPKHPQFPNKYKTPVFGEDVKLASGAAAQSARSGGFDPDFQAWEYVSGSMREEEKQRLVQQYANAGEPESNYKNILLSEHGSAVLFATLRGVLDAYVHGIKCVRNSDISTDMRTQRVIRKYPVVYMLYQFFGAEYVFALYEWYNAVTRALVLYSMKGIRQMCGPVQGKKDLWKNTASWLYHLNNLCLKLESVQDRGLFALTRILKIACRSEITDKYSRDQKNEYATQQGEYLKWLQITLVEDVRLWTWLDDSLLLFRTHADFESKQESDELAAVNNEINKCIQDLKFLWGQSATGVRQLNAADRRALAASSMRTRQLIEEQYEFMRSSSCFVIPFREHEDALAWKQEQKQQAKDISWLVPALSFMPDFDNNMPYLSVYAYNIRTNTEMRLCVTRAMPVPLLLFYITMQYLFQSGYPSKPNTKAATEVLPQLMPAGVDLKKLTYIDDTKSNPMPSEIVVDKTYVITQTTAWNTLMCMFSLAIAAFKQTILYKKASGTMNEDRHIKRVFAYYSFFDVLRLMSAEPKFSLRDNAYIKAINQTSIVRYARMLLQAQSRLYSFKPISEPLLTSLTVMRHDVSRVFVRNHAMQIQTTRTADLSRDCVILRSDSGVDGLQSWSTADSPLHVVMQAHVMLPHVVASLIRTYAIMQTRRKTNVMLVGKDLFVDALVETKDMAVQYTRSDEYKESVKDFDARARDGRMSTELLLLRKYADQLENMQLQYDNTDGSGDLRVPRTYNEYSVASLQTKRFLFLTLAAPLNANDDVWWRSSIRKTPFSSCINLRVVLCSILHNTESTSIMDVLPPRDYSITYPPLRQLMKYHYASASGLNGVEYTRNFASRRGHRPLRVVTAFNLPKSTVFQESVVLSRNKKILLSVVRAMTRADAERVSNTNKNNEARNDAILLVTDYWMVYPLFERNPVFKNGITSQYQYSMYSHACHEQTLKRTNEEVLAILNQKFMTPFVERHCTEEEQKAFKRRQMHFISFPWFSCPTTHVVCITFTVDNVNPYASVRTPELQPGDMKTIPQRLYRPRTVTTHGAMSVATIPAAVQSVPAYARRLADQDTKDDLKTLQPSPRVSNRSISASTNNVSSSGKKRSLLVSEKTRKREEHMKKNLHSFLRKQRSHRSIFRAYEQDAKAC